MKRRSGLVSNSSSSSFTCEVCGEVCSGMDMSLGDFEMVECTAGHVFCEEHQLPMTDKVAAILVQNAVNDGELERDEQEEAEKRLAKGTVDVEYVETFDRDEIFGSDWDYEFHSELCPLCQLSEISDKTLAKFMLHEMNVTREKAEDVIRHKFKNLAEMNEALKA